MGEGALLLFGFGEAAMAALECCWEEMSWTKAKNANDFHVFICAV